jgi:hypothetical protein
MVDPRLIYDNLSQRWIACAIDRGSQGILIAISRDADPVGTGGSSWVSDKWVKHLVPVGGTFSDFDTLGVDSNGIYVSCMRPLEQDTVIATIPKAMLLAAANETIISANYITVLNNIGSQNAFTTVSYDAATSDSQWILFGSTGGIWYKRITWNNGVPAYDTSWTVLTDPTPYAPISTGMAGPQRGTSAYKVELNIVGSRLTSPIMRRVNGIQYLWTSRAVAVNASGGASNPDRTAIEWLRIPTSSPANIASGLIRDATSAQTYYYTPSIAVNRYGDVAVGFSGSSVNDYIGAYYTGRLNAGNWPADPKRYFSGIDWYYGEAQFRWGDFSATVVDPNGTTFWTIQEYADARWLQTSPNAFGTRIAEITP